MFPILVSSRCSTATTTKLVSETTHANEYAHHGSYRPWRRASPSRTPEVISKGLEKSSSNTTYCDAITNSPSIQKKISKISTRRSSFGYNEKTVSKAVRKIAIIAKNRDERRQRQADEKAIKQAVIKEESGNPYWEFLHKIKEFRCTLEIQTIRISDPVLENQITVCVRKRPLNLKEIRHQEIDVITIPGRDRLILHEPRSKVDLKKYIENQKFRFDYVFDETTNNDLVYKFTAQPLLKTVFEGGMATCFAYGQTGAGKTHTMGGEFKGKQQNFTNGIYGLVARDVFANVRNYECNDQKIVVSASFFEIYGRFVFDLLAKKQRLRVLEDGKQVVQIVGLTEKIVASVQDVLTLIQKGSLERTSGQTSANCFSSRSHAVFQILLRKSGTPSAVIGKFSLIDLAGNERGADTSKSNRQTRLEGADINKSLLALKECIRALGRKSTHCPFRGSKLTQVLRDSFIGEKSRTCMIALISPSISSWEHTLNTLRYADRVKELAVFDEIFDDTRSQLSSPRLELEVDGVDELSSNSDESSEESSSNMSEWEIEVRKSHRSVLYSTACFYNNAIQHYYKNQKKDYNKLEYLKEWKKMLQQLFDVQKDALGKASDYCDLLEVDH